jgi:hypothetical protein
MQQMRNRISTGARSDGYLSTLAFFGITRK